MGNPVVHWELLSKDPAKLSAFYEKVFAWKIQHRPELNYRIVDTGGEVLIEEQEVPGMGRFSLFKDPDGRMIGLWKHST